MESNTHELEVGGASLALGGKPVLRGIDLALPRGQVLALLGASGCGKTTLLRSVAGLTALDQGRIRIGGRDVSALPAQQRGIGVVFQHYALFPNLSVLENIKFGVLCDGHPQPEAEQRARELLELVDLQALAERRPARLSGGQRQRVALARALARHPSLLLMDEPFSALDESFRIPLRRAFRQLQKRLGQSCLIVTHDREEAFELADQVAVMFEGRIAQCGSPAELWQQPASRRVADFLGAFNAFDPRSLPAPWQRDSGHWLAPIGALALDPDPSAAFDGLRLSARVEAVYAGTERLTVQLQGEGPLTLHAAHGQALPEPGQHVALKVQAEALRWVDR